MGISSRSGTVELGQTVIQPGTQFDYASDDPEFVQAIKWKIVSDPKDPEDVGQAIEWKMAGVAKLPESVVEIVGKLQLENNLHYLIGLIRVENEGSRSFAVERVMKLTNLKVNLPGSVETTAEMKAEITKLIQQLDDGKASRRESATEKLMEVGKAATLQLREILQSGSPEQKARARKILDSNIEYRNIEIEKEVGRLLNWYDENREKLEFDEQAGVFKIAS